MHYFLLLSLVLKVVLFPDVSMALSLSLDKKTRPIIEEGWLLVEDTASNPKFRSFRKLDKNTSLLAMRFITIIDYPIEKAASVWFANHEQKRHWMDLCADFVEIEKISQNAAIHQFIGETPVFFVAPRTFVSKVTISIDKKNKVIAGSAKSVDYPNIKIPDGMVLGKILDSQTLMAQVTPEKTFLDLSVLVDPAGSVPKFLVNWVATGWPKKTYEGLLEQLEKNVAREVNFFGE